MLTPAFRWRRLALPLTLVMLGLALVSALEISGVHAYLVAPAAEKAAGLIAVGGAVVLWTWYALANARFLAGHHDMAPASWSTIVGVATGAVALAGLPVAADTGQLAAPATGHPGTGKLIAGVIFLGVVVSWAGTSLMEPRLESAVARPRRGCWSTWETVTGFSYVYAARHQWPPAGQLAGLILVMAGVTLTLIPARPGRPFLGAPWAPPTGGSSGG